MVKNVLYSQRVEVVEDYNERRDSADQKIPKFIEVCGYLPIPVPNIRDIIDKYIEQFKPVGIILTGGNSLVKYKGNAPERDITDKKLLEIAIKQNIPVYGFCRGMQSILDYFGNELVGTNSHVGKRHEVICEGDRYYVNSNHSLGCLKMKNEDFKVICKTEDGVIEEIKHTKYSIEGTMWHPEREEPFNERDIIRIQKLFG